MHPRPRGSRSIALTIIAASFCSVTPACSPSFNDYTAEGTRLLEEGRYAAARGQFLAAEGLVPENAENLCNLARCHMELAREYRRREDPRGALREIDRATAYYRRAVRSYPGNQRALEGLNEALEMRGMYPQALEVAEWASSVVGPAAGQQLFLAREYAERGDADHALLAYKQAVAMDPANPTLYWALGLYCLRIEQREDGIENLQQAYRLDPTREYVADELRRLGAEVPEMDLGESG